MLFHAAGQWVEWTGAGVASGVYYYRITAGDNVETKQMVLLK